MQRFARLDIFDLGSITRFKLLVMALGRLLSLPRFDILSFPKWAFLSEEVKYEKKGRSNMMDAIDIAGIANIDVLH